MLAEQIRAIGHEDIMRMVQEANAQFSPRADLPFGGGPKLPFAEGEVPNLIKQVMAEKAAQKAAEESGPAQVVDLPVDPVAPQADDLDDAYYSDAPDLADAPVSDTDEEAFSPAPPPAEIDIEAIRAEAFEAGRAAAMAEIEAAREEAYQQAMEDAQAALDSELAEARDMLVKAAEAFAAQQESASAELKGQLKEAVRTLAGQRAGQAIDAMPLPFMVRIMKLTERVAHASGAAMLKLHPADLKAVRPHLADSTLPKDLSLVADEDMTRGDVVFRLGTLTVTDLLDPKYSMERG